MYIQLVWSLKSQIVKPYTRSSYKSPNNNPTRPTAPVVHFGMSRSAAAPDVALLEALDVPEVLLGALPEELVAVFVIT